MVLIHGAGGSRRDWTENVAGLAEAARVYAPDVIGFGDTPQRDFPHTVGYMSDFMRDFLDAAGIQQTVIVGHSLGGRIALEVARAFPERVSKLVLVAPLGFGELSTSGRFIGWAAWALRKASILKSPYPELDLTLHEPDSSAFESVGCETLLLWGAKDQYFPTDHAYRALSMIPNSRLKVYSGVGHGLHQTIPVHFASDVLSFVDEA